MNYHFPSNQKIDPMEYSTCERDYKDRNTDFLVALFVGGLLVAGFIGYVVPYIFI